MLELGSKYMARYSCRARRRGRGVEAFGPSVKGLWSEAWNRLGETARSFHETRCPSQRCYRGRGPAMLRWHTSNPGADLCYVSAM